MHRRSFITLLGGAAAAWPVTARAQQAALPVVGVLGGGSRSAFEFALPAFAEGLGEQGYADGQNVNVYYSWADGHYDLLPEMATEFVRRRVAVIVTLTGTVTAEAAKAATATLPIVFSLGTDPVAGGLVASLNRPGGNMTGSTILTIDLAPKRLELMRDLVPGIMTIGYLLNPDNVSAAQEVQVAARTLGLQVHAVGASVDRDFDSAFAQFLERRVGAVLIGGDPFHISRRERIVALAARHRIPAVYADSAFVKAGGLMSYGANRMASYVIAGSYVGRILKGEKPADLPVVQPSTFELAINLKAAKALGLDFPQIIAARATEVIE